MNDFSNNPTGKPAVFSPGNTTAAAGVRLPSPTVPDLAKTNIPAPATIPNLPKQAAPSVTPPVAASSVAHPSHFSAVTTEKPASKSKKSVLDEVDILRPLSPMLKSQLEAQLAERTLKKGEILFQEGDLGDAMYVITAGMISVYVTDQSLGLTMDLATLGRGEAFGEMALVTGERRSATVKSVEDGTRVLGLSRDVFYRLVQAVPQVGLTIASTLAKRLEQVNRTKGVSFGSLRSIDFDKSLKDLLPSSVVHRHRVVPVAQEGNIITVATPDPNNKLAIDDVKRVLRGNDVKLMAVSEQDFDSFLVRHFPQMTSPATKQGIKVDYGILANSIAFENQQSADDLARDQQLANTPDAVDLVNRIFAEAIGRSASDIHIEPGKEFLKIRYRVDGRLTERTGSIPMGGHGALVSRMKILAEMDIAERRLPQDGRISFALGEGMNAKSYDLRMSTINTKYGEKVTFRVLDSSSLESDIGSLVLADKVSQVIRQLIYRPNGLVLVTGPTGSGKTTTLYASLLERRNPELNLCTIEDPIEYNLEGLNQVQVNESIGLGFPDIMRSFLRQDPDIILLGETRDSETAKLACNAALTGHLVLTSFHTNDAISAVQRLRAMDVEEFMIADSLLGVINQRLVRKICPACRVAVEPTELILQNLERANVRLDKGTLFYRGEGCGTCGGDGFKGRTGVYELLVNSPAVKEVISVGASAADIKTAASADGSWVPLSRYASFLLNAGATTPAEILRILPRE